MAANTLYVCLSKYMSFSSPNWVGVGVASAALVALLVTGLILVKSIKDFSQGGPQLRGEIKEHYRFYAVYATGRLVWWAFVIAFLMAIVGVLIYGGLCVLLEWTFQFWLSCMASIAAILFITATQFAYYLFYSPGIIASSSHYRLSRLHWFWRLLSPRRLKIVRGGGVIGATLVIAWALQKLGSHGDWHKVAEFVCITLIVALAYAWSTFSRESKNIRKTATARQDAPNILMVGCDTLRADRVGPSGYPRRLTPFIDGLLKRGTLFTNCYVPLARTAPSLTSYLTGMWPHRHGVRDNFFSSDQKSFPDLCLPKLLSEAGYETAVISDWAGSDFGKYDFGFTRLDVPEDQWNIKYYIRQGPKDLRLFLSLFAHNHFGKTFLPEIYYLAGAPLSGHLGRRARHLLTEHATRNVPFLLNVFMGTCHPPFASEYPYYTTYTDPEYDGQSKFIMSKLTDPLEIIRSQREPKEAFDLEQIINLYDGCVRNFDEEVRKILNHLNDVGLRDNTIVVIYSDHGMEFFEHDTWGQGNSAIGDFSARVPLLLLDPRREARGIVSNIVRTIDLAPTLLELVGLPVPEKMEGVSLTGILDDPKKELGLEAYFETGTWLTTQPGAHPLHLEYPDLLELLEVKDKKTGTLVIKQRYYDVVIEARDRMIRSGNWLLVYLPLRDGALYRLFNVQDDPQCLKDVSNYHPDVVSQLRQKLVAWMSGDEQREWRDEHLARRMASNSLDRA